MQGKAAYNRPLWSDPSPDPAYSGSFSVPGLPLPFSNSLAGSISSNLFCSNRVMTNVEPSPDEQGSRTKVLIISLLESKKKRSCVLMEVDCSQTSNIVVACPSEQRGYKLGDL